MASFSETGTKPLEFYFQCFNMECLKCSGLIIPEVAARPLPHARQGLPRLLLWSKIQGLFPIPGSLEVDEELYDEAVILEGKKYVSNQVASGISTGFSV